MGFSLHIHCDPWDIFDAGVEAMLDRLRGEVGADGLTVGASIAPTTELRSAPREPRVFSTRGGAFFMPRESMFARLHCRPVVSTWIRDRDPVEAARKLSDTHRLAFRVHVSATRTGRLAERYPELACRNVFGAESVASVCLQHPHVQEYLVALAGNVAAAYAPAAIVLGDVIGEWTESYSPGLRAPSALDDAARIALATCFCESCARRAREQGIDVDLARREAEQIIMAGSVPCDSHPTSHSILKKWRASQRSAAAEFIQHLRANCTKPVLMESPWSQDSVGMICDIARMTSAEDVASIGESQPAPAEIRLDAEWTLRDQGAPLVALLSDAARVGVTGATIDSLGMLSEASLTTLRQAVRYARRS